MKINVAGQAYNFDETRLTVKEARTIKKYGGLSVRQFANGLSDMDVEAMVAVVFLAKQRAGEVLRWQDLDELNLNDINLAPDTVEDATDGSADEGQEADPTQPSDSGQNVQP